MSTWADIFFSSNPPKFINEVEDSQQFRSFSPVTSEWHLGKLVDESRPVDANKIQVFWLRSNRRRDSVAKVFPDYTSEQAAEQMRRLRFPESQIQSHEDDAWFEFDNFHREARAYTHIERFCPSNEQIYFPHFRGVLTELERSKFSSGYAHSRALVLEAIKPESRCRRIPATNCNRMPDSFQRGLPLTRFEREWYWSLLCDRLRRLAALHSIGITRGDLQDHHFRIPGDFYDTVLFDFSASYTFTPRRPFRLKESITMQILEGSYSMQNAFSEVAFSATGQEFAYRAEALERRPALAVQDRCFFLAARVPAAPLMTLVVVNLLYVLCGVVFALVALVAARGGVPDIQRRLTIAGLVADRFEEQRQVESTEEMFEEYAGKESRRVAVAPAPKGGYEY
ncbi:hypothetical protein BJY01DRAFT_248147 [Aspergillus pseudoustus]|uniref:Protein kinase domain-containing protein n=1 Tax=Aspergillus pseudoustus TaxID=1810923 RepID=A0ABR4JWX0_9EURO